MNITTMTPRTTTRMTTAITMTMTVVSAKLLVEPEELAARRERGRESCGHYHHRTLTHQIHITYITLIYNTHITNHTHTHTHTHTQTTSHITHKHANTTPRIEFPCKNLHVDLPVLSMQNTPLSV